MNESNFEPAAFILSVLCLFYCMTSKRRQYKLSKDILGNLQNQHFIFLLLLVSTILSSAASVAGLYLQKIASGKTVFWQYIFHAAYFIFHSAAAICLSLYIMHINGSSSYRSRMFYTLFSLPFLLCEILVLTNSFTDAVFFMDEHFIYHRGFLISVFYVCGIFYLTVAFISFFRHERAISKSDSRAIGFLMSLCALGVFLQGMFSGFLVELFAETLAFAGMLLILEERSGHIDSITGLLNRVALVEDCRRFIEAQQSCRFIFIKLTNVDIFYKLFNGRDMNKLLLEISKWLTEFFPKQKLYSYRNKVFGIFFQDSAESNDQIAVNAILNRFGQDWKIGKMSLRLEIIASVVRIPQDVSSVDDFLELLASEYQNSRHISREISYTELSLDQRNKRIEQALREAVEKDQFQVWYQPIYSTDAQKTVAAEALLRVDSDTLRGISPEIFIPIAEKCGIIREIGFFVFEAVCRLLQNPRVKELGLSYIELNLSVYQFMFDDLISRFEKIRSEYGIPVEALNLEITESASADSMPVIKHTMEELQKIGYTFSLDDFGVGYSNIKQLINKSYKNIKIDKSLLWNAEKNNDAAQLWDSLIHLIRKLGYSVVQEGVETSAQLEKTIASGGNLIQGYYFSRPVPEREFIAYLENETR